MKRAFRVVLALVSVALLALPSAALAADVYHFPGDEAFASFYHESDDGCILTYVGIFAIDNVDHNPPGEQASDSQANLSISQYDVCSDTPLIGAYGTTLLADTEFQVSHQLESSELATTIEVYDYHPDTSFPVTVDLSWTGTGAIARGNGTFHYQSPDFTVHSHYNGTYHAATASGTIGAGNTNFTPGPSMDAQLASVKSGTVSIGEQIIMEPAK